ncbi:hypothetical protein HNP69_000680 [Chryseobacterium koreense]|nr:hypothetical protein [Chryseobacterium koreense]
MHLITLWWIGNNLADLGVTGKLRKPEQPENNEQNETYFLTL